MSITFVGFEEYKSHLNQLLTKYVTSCVDSSVWQCGLYIQCISVASIYMGGCLLVYPLLTKHIDSPNKQAVDLGAGSMAGLTAVALTYPLDTVRARLATQINTPGANGQQYKGVIDALVKIPRQDGMLYVLYDTAVCGFSPLSASCPYNLNSLLVAITTCV